MEKPRRFTFSTGRTAQATQGKHAEEFPVALHELGLRSTYPAQVLIGGASKKEGEAVDRLRLLFAEGLIEIKGEPDRPGSLKVHRILLKTCRQTGIDTGFELQEHRNSAQYASYIATR